MEKRIKEYSVGQLARVSGVTVRTLHHYDDIGLLVPAHVGENGYRTYGRREQLRLQEILFYRETGMTLADIRDVMDGPGDAISRLLAHRDLLAKRVQQTTAMLATLDATILHLKGKTDMATADLYKPFTEKQQAAYEAWLIETYGKEMAQSIAISKNAIEKYPSGMAGLMDRLKQIETALVAQMLSGVDADSPQNHAILEDHRALMAEFWGKPCDADGVDGLAAQYAGHPDFVARYESLSPKFSVWLPVAMKAHAGRLRGANELEG